MSDQSHESRTPALYPSNYDNFHRHELRLPVQRDLALSQGDYDRFRIFVLERIGLDFPEDKRAMLGRGLAQVMDVIGCADLDELYRRLSNLPTSGALWDQVISVLTVGETYFFRNTSHFDALTKYVLPRIVQEREHTNRRIRIWCAGCSTGEEPYSIAILLKEILPNLESWNVLVLATDINREALKKAQAARYSAWSFRGVEKRVQDTYFQLDGNQYVLADAIQRMVTFDYLNLVSDPFPSLTNNTNAMDIILCRNVTIYFNERVTRAVIQKIHASLVNDGWFIPGPSEPNMLYYSDFSAQNFPGTVVYQKPSALHLKPRVKPFKPIEMPPPVLPIASTPAPQPARAPAAPPPDAYKQALELLREGKSDAALAKLYEKIDRDAQFAPAYFTLGKIYANKGNLEKAQHWCERAIRLDKMHPEPYYTLSLVYQQHGLLDMAVDALKKTIYLDRDFALARYNLAQIYRRQGEREQARRELQNVQRMLQAKPRDEVVPEGDGLVVARLLELVANELALDE
ncbi:MAG: tetratricopeptide repeat protein [Chloroflexi bacterium]|nr:tetratricopeptide repeat protein [Chloroflexota bacterium]